MASIYLELRKEENKRGERQIRIVIVVKGKTSRLSTGYALPEKYWDDDKKEVKGRYPNASEINGVLSDKLNAARKLYALMDSVDGSPDAKAIAKAATIGGKFFDIAEHYAKAMDEAGHLYAGTKYRTVKNMVEKYYPGIKVAEMGMDWHREFCKKIAHHAHNYQVGIKKNLDTILNKAQADRIIIANKVKGAKKGTFRNTDHQLLTQKEVDAIWNLELSNPNEATARDCFLFSYYASGARFKDVLLMPKTALYKEEGKYRLRWHPYKTAGTTGETLDIKVSPRLKKIIDRHIDNESTTIFGLVPLVEDKVRLRRLYEARQTVINEDLKKVFIRAGVEKDLSFHDARRTISKHLKAIGADIYTIKDILGHEKVATTEGYVGRNQKGVDDLLTKLYK